MDWFWEPRERTTVRWLAIIFTLILWGCLMLGILPYSQEGKGWLEYFDGQILDTYMRIRNAIQGKNYIDDQIVLVGIDDFTNENLAPYGKGVWIMRQPFIQLVNHFESFYHPRVVAFDILFLNHLIEKIGDDPALYFPPAVFEQITETVQQLKQSQIELESQLPSFVTMAQLASWLGEVAFAEAIGSMSQRGISPILAYYFPDDPRAKERIWPVEAILGKDPHRWAEEQGTILPDLKKVSIPSSMIENIPEDFPFRNYPPRLPSGNYLEYGKLGTINVDRDVDGIIRRYPLLIGMEYSYKHPETGTTIRNRLFLPSLGFLAFLSYHQIDLQDFHQTSSSPRAHIRIKMGDSLKVWDRSGRLITDIPVDSYGRIYLNYHGSIQDYPSVSFVSCLGNYEKLRPFLQDKIVFVGVTATGTTDIGATPVGQISPLVLVHMAALNNLTRQTALRPLSVYQRIGFGILLLGTIGLYFLSFHRAVIWILLGITGYLILCFYSVYYHWWVLPVLGPVLFLTLVCFLIMLVYYLTEQWERKRIRKMFQTMVSAEVLHYMEQNPHSFSLAGETRMATVFFSDIAGFTTISEKLPPQQLVLLLNQYLTPMTDIILKHNGYIDKYEGDAIMAEWGVPFPSPHHAIDAARAALEQQEILNLLRPTLRDQFGCEIHVRMGINTGLVSAGNMGSSKRFSYTVMGDTVNLAARLEPINKDYGTKIIVGETTAKEIGHIFQLRMLDRIQVKGKTIPVTIYELVGEKEKIDDQMKQLILLYEKGLQLHWERRFEDALGILFDAQKVNPTDLATQRLIQRIHNYLEDPPHPEWQGEYVRSTKD